LLNGYLNSSAASSMPVENFLRRIVLRKETLSENPEVKCIPISRSTPDWKKPTHPGETRPAESKSEE